MLLTKAEEKELNRGPKKTVKVGSFEKVMILRGKQSIKDRAIENFAYQWLGQLERFSVSSADKRHAKTLFRLLKEAGV